MMAALRAGFLADRLAKASAVPVEQRSADVRAFIETCALQAELVEELGLPEAVRDNRERKDFKFLSTSLRLWSAAPALKLVRSHFISPAGPLPHSPQLHFFATFNVDKRTSFGIAGDMPHDLGRELTELLEGDPGLQTFAILAAGLPGVDNDHSQRRGLLKMSNRAVALMRGPAVRRRLQSELAALPQQMISYEELLAFFIDYGSLQARHLHMKVKAGAPLADIRTAVRLAVELLPQLAPDNPRLRYEAAMASFTSFALESRAAFRMSTMLTAALDVARQQGSDFFSASCGYNLATDVNLWVTESALQHDVPPPSAVLGWLQQAEAAHRRCKALLPKYWTRDLDDLKALAATPKAYLQHLQQQGDRWHRLTPSTMHDMEAAIKNYHETYGNLDPHKKTLTCSGCGDWAPQVRLCGACREAQYCSVECQKAHWKEHKARCKEVQAAKAAASGDASTSGGGS